MKYVLAATAFLLASTACTTLPPEAPVAAMARLMAVNMGHQVCLRDFIRLTDESTGQPVGDTKKERLRQIAWYVINGRQFGQGAAQGCIHVLITR